MSPRQLDTDPEEIEVKFNSCVCLTVICHRTVFQQLKDGAAHPRDPSPTMGKNFVEFDLVIGDPTKERINWGYNTPDPTQDHGFLTVDVIPAPGVTNPLDQLRREIVELKAELASLR
jgi:hypothetical protein